MSKPDKGLEDVGGGNREGRQGSAPLTVVSAVVAVAVLVAWLVFVKYMVDHTSVADVTWGRLVTILGGVEAVAFAAAGALFGTTVQRGRVEDQKKRADSNEKAKIDGKVLANTVKAFTTGAKTARASGDQLIGELDALADKVLQD